MAGGAQPRISVETVVCGVVGVALVASGLWAFADADSFYRVIAEYPPYNAHFLHDIGSFLVGLGVALTSAVYVRDGLRVALAGNAAAAVLHAAGHIRDRHLGGNSSDPVTLSLLAVVLVLTAAMAWRRRAGRQAAGDPRAE